MKYGNLMRTNKTKSCFILNFRNIIGILCAWVIMMMMMMMMMIMMNCFCGMVDRRKAFTLNSSRDHCQRFSPSRISDRPRAVFEPALNLSSGLVECSCAVVITTTPRRHLEAVRSNLEAVTRGVL